MMIRGRWRSLILAVTLTFRLLPLEALSRLSPESGHECCRHGRAARCSSHCIRKGKARAAKSDTLGGAPETPPKQALSCHPPEVYSSPAAEEPSRGICIVSECDRDPSPQVSFGQDLYVLGRPARIPADTLIASEVHVNPASLAPEAFFPPPDPPPQSF